MRSFIYSLIFSSTCMLPLHQAQAQKKQTIYYPNGKVAFEGRFQLAWNQTERFEYPEDQEGDPELSENMVFEDREFMLHTYRDIIPARIYEGKCRYYYQNGKLFASGNYKAGFKNGTFKFYHPNGQLGALQSYEWGMASGHWEYWDEQGRLSGSFHYQRIPENTLLRINGKRLLSGKNEPERDLKLFFGMDYADFFKHSSRELNDHWRNLNIFEQYVTKRLYHKAIKEGEFKVWEQGKPYLEMHFSNNIPVGSWRIYKNDKPVFEIVFESGKIIKATDFLDPANNFGSPEYLARKAAETRGVSAGDVNAIDPGLAPREEIFKTVQQMPQAGYDFNNYIIKNLKAPKNIDVSRGTRVIVEFVVRKDGSIDKVRAIRSEKVDPALVAEVVKVMQQMPKWKPGMQNGRAVDVTLTYPVQLEIQ